MPKFGKRSLERLETCDERIQSVMHELIKLMDVTVLEGHRSNERQAELLAAGKSKLGPGKSKHNQMPSLAIDIAPWPIDWDDAERFSYMAGLAKGIAHAQGVTLRWGGDWDSDGELSDNRFNDLPHLEIA